MGYISKNEFVRRCAADKVLIDVLQKNNCGNRFFHNIIKMGPDSYIEDYDMDDTVRISFSWIGSPEGLSFWSSVSSDLTIRISLEGSS